MSLGLALSGGGTKGAVHIGVLRALEEENINIDYISGCSSGSIIASLFATGYTSTQLLAIFKSYCKDIIHIDKTIPMKLAKVFFTNKVSIKGLVNLSYLEKTIYNFLKQKKVIDIKDVKIPLAIPTVDIDTGKLIYYINNNKRIIKDNIWIRERGNLASIVTASSSLPGIFSPKYLDNNNLIDGGVLINTPVSILKQMGADIVVAVNFVSKSKMKDLGIVSVIKKSFDIMGKELNKKELKKADLVINIDLNDDYILDCSNTSKLANLGYKAVKDNIDEIKKYMT